MTGLEAGSSSTVVWLSVGLLAAAVYVGLAPARAGRGLRAYYAWGLVVAAAIYVGFAAWAASPLWLAIELAGLAIFGLAAWLGRRGDLAWLALGWTLHPLWDAGLHLTASGVAPRWYVLACLSFDLLVGSVLFVRRRVERRGASD